MTTEIPTYEIGIVEDVDYLIKIDNMVMPQGIDPESSVADAFQIPYYEGCRLRLYGNPDFGDDSPSLMYGPGSVTYEVVGVVLDNADHMTSDLPIDPKTYVDAYGYIHVGASNMPVDPTNGEWVVLKIKPTYHYINPTTGNEVKVSPADNALLYIALMYEAANIDVAYSENERSIPYAPTPSDRLGLD